jgi:hypothetical protein
MKTDRPDRNQAMGNLDNELSGMLDETGEHIIEDYLDTFLEVFDDLKIGPSYPPVPVEVLDGIAIAFANASGYRVVLEADIKQPVKGKRNVYRTVGHRTVVVAEP